MKYTRKSLKQEIQLLEIRKEKERADFIQHLKVTFDSLRPMNLIRSSLRDFSNAVEVRSGILETILPLLTNFISGRMILRTPGNSFRRIVATVVQVGMTNFTAKYSHAIVELFTEFADRIKELLSRGKSVTEESEEETDADPKVGNDSTPPEDKPL